MSSNCISVERIKGWILHRYAYIHGMQHVKWERIHCQLNEINETGYIHTEPVSINILLCTIMYSWIPKTAIWRIFVSNYHKSLK